MWNILNYLMLLNMGFVSLLIKIEIGSEINQKKKKKRKSYITVILKVEQSQCSPHTKVKITKAKLINLC